MKTLIVVMALSTLALFDSSVAMAQASMASPVPTTHAQNRKLSKAVRQALDKTKGLVSANIAIVVKAGTVALVGSVPDQKQIDLAGAVAQKVPNVKSVDNRLEVDEEGN